MVTNWCGKYYALEWRESILLIYVHLMNSRTVNTKLNKIHLECNSERCPHVDVYDSHDNGYGAHDEGYGAHDDSNDEGYDAHYDAHYDGYDAHYDSNDEGYGAHDNSSDSHVDYNETDNYYNSYHNKNCNNTTYNQKTCTTTAICTKLDIGSSSGGIHFLSDDSRNEHCHACYIQFTGCGLQFTKNSAWSSISGGRCASRRPEGTTQHLSHQGPPRKQRDVQHRFQVASCFRHFKFQVCSGNQLLIIEAILEYGKILEKTNRKVAQTVTISMCKAKIYPVGN
ncbi:hypothetical protein PR048_030894 [Dryococelus australis]|uniref:Uncharacterized protein n=1 Tax=Dryococelus australis TaxID=614101 RepID=A0ABQ9GA60_9NEOP|nr:hypothetical protein PR048_030894 [Dryococelus australis]